MATCYQNLSHYAPDTVPAGDKYNIGIVAAEWNPDITLVLLEGARKTLIQHGVKQENISVVFVPGTFELTYAAKRLMMEERYDAIIVLGAVVRGDTPHFDYVCSGVTQGITALNLLGELPIIFGVLTTDDMQQALDRAGGKHGNKGVEAAVTALKMTSFIR